jgi:hypothetical protein
MVELAIRGEPRHAGGTQPIWRASFHASVVYLAGGGTVEIYDPRLEKVPRAIRQWHAPQGWSLNLHNYDNYVTVGTALDPSFEPLHRSSWFAVIDEQLHKLIQLPQGWDSYRARQISEGTAAATLRLLCRVMRDETPPPSIVPMARGGIQLEWHLRSMNIEVTVPSPGGPVEVWWEDLRSGEEQEFVLPDDPDALRTVLAVLTSRD